MDIKEIIHITDNTMGFSKEPVDFNKKRIIIKPNETFTAKIKVNEEWVEKYIKWVLSGEEIIDVPALKELNEELLKERNKNV